MSNGTLAELPPENIPDTITMPDEPSVMLLLPHNKYLLGTGSDKWIYASETPGTQPKNVFLYEGEKLSLLNDGTPPTVLPAVTVNALRKELLQQSEPPGRHSATVLMLRTFMRGNPAFASDSAEFLDEEYFAEFMRNDLVLCKTYWTVRFALARGEMEAVGRIKAWLKADPENFTKQNNTMRLWFSIQDMPDEEALAELEELSFSRIELKRMALQNVSPIVVYNPVSGWLVLGRFGRDKNTMFTCWLLYSHNLWFDLREKKKMTVHDIILASWAEHDTRKAMIERAKYKGGVI